MDTHMQKEDEVLILEAMLHLRRLTLDGFKKKNFGFTKTQLMILAALYGRESLNMSQVAGYVSSSNEQTTRAVAPLVDAGYVERFIVPENRTKVHVRLTQEGVALVEKARANVYAELEKRLDSNVGTDEKTQLGQALGTAVQIMEKVK